MEDIQIFDMSSEELYDLMDTARVNLSRKNLEYKKLKNEVSEIVKQYPNIDIIFMILKLH